MKKSIFALVLVLGQMGFVGPVSAEREATDQDCLRQLQIANVILGKGANGPRCSALQAIDRYENSAGICKWALSMEEHQKISEAFKLCQGEF